MAMGIGVGQGLRWARSGCQRVSICAAKQLPRKALIQLDLRTAKEFHFGERMRLQLLAEMYNLFNRKNSCNFVTTLFTIPMAH